MRHVQVHGPTPAAVLRIYLNCHTRAGLCTQPTLQGRATCMCMIRSGCSSGRHIGNLRPHLKHVMQTCSNARGAGVGHGLTPVRDPASAATPASRQLSAHLARHCGPHAHSVLVDIRSGQPARIQVVTHHFGNLYLHYNIAQPMHAHAHSATSHGPSAGHTRMHSSGRALELAAERRRAAWNVERLLCGKRVRNIGPRSKVHHAAPICRRAYASVPYADCLRRPAPEWVLLAVIQNSGHPRMTPGCMAMRACLGVLRCRLRRTDISCDAVCLRSTSPRRART